MFNAVRSHPPAELEWMGWPTYIRQRALCVIATTRSEWASRSASGEPVADRGRTGRPKFGDALDARRRVLADGMGNTFAVGVAGGSEPE